MLRSFISQMIFPLDNGIHKTPDSNKISPQIQKLNDTIPYIHIKSTSNRNDLAILYFHGNADSIAFKSNNILLKQLSSFFDVDVFSYDYPGTIDSGYNNRTTRGKEVDIEKIIYHDASTMYEYIVKSYKKILLIGHSIGSAPALFIGSKEKIEAIALLAPFVSILSVVLPNKVVENTFLSRFDLFNNKIQLEDIDADVPIIFIHGKDDSVISYKNSITLYNSCTIKKNKELYVLDGYNHNSIFDFAPDLFVLIQQII